MKLAIVHDYLIQYGGAERVIEVLHDLFPEAPVFTSVYDPAAFPEAFRRMDIRPSFLQRVAVRPREMQRWLLPLYPLAFLRMDLRGFDVVLSSASAFAKGVSPRPPGRHICYCYAPTRFLWQHQAYATQEGLGTLARASLRMLLPWLRRWDLAAARRVDRFVAISRAVAGRVQAIYGRPAAVIYPPVALPAFRPPADAGEGFLVVSRLVPQKRIDVAIEALNRWGEPLVIIGEGRDRARLERLAGKNIRFLGRVPEAALAAHYRACRALIVPGEEDFGLTAVEAQAHGRPVVAFAGGGALETVAEGVSGVFFREHTADALVGAFLDFDRMRFDPLAIRRRAEAFDRAVFMDRLGGFVAGLADGRSADGDPASGDGHAALQPATPKGVIGLPPSPSLSHSPQRVATARD